MNQDNKLICVLVPLLSGLIFATHASAHPRHHEGDVAQLASHFFFAPSHIAVLLGAGSILAALLITLAQSRKS